MPSDNTKRHDTLESEHEIDSETMFKLNDLKSRLSFEFNTINGVLSSPPVSTIASKQYCTDFQNSECVNSLENIDKSTNSNNDNLSYGLSIQATIAKELSEYLNLRIVSLPKKYAILVADAIEYGKAFMALSFMLYNDNDKYDAKDISRMHGESSMKTRWGKYNIRIHELCKEADERWNGGCSLLHNEMADALLLPSDIDLKITRSILIQKFRPIAKGYGKIRGEKGVRKTPHT